MARRPVRTSALETHGQRRRTEPELGRLESATVLPISGQTRQRCGAAAYDDVKNRPGGCSTIGQCIKFIGDRAPAEPLALKHKVAGERPKGAISVVPKYWLIRLVASFEPRETWKLHVNPPRSCDVPTLDVHGRSAGFNMQLPVSVGSNDATSLISQYFGTTEIAPFGASPGHLVLKRKRSAGADRL